MRDLRFATRSLQRAVRSPRFAVLSIGIGIGLSTPVYAMIDRLTHPLTAARERRRTLSHSSVRLRTGSRVDRGTIV